MTRISWSVLLSVALLLAPAAESHASNEQQGIPFRSFRALQIRARGRYEIAEVLLRDNGIEARVSSLCVVASESDVTCIPTVRFFDDFPPGAIDELYKLSLNDLMSQLGGSSADNTITACLNGSDLGMTTGKIPSTVTNRPESTSPYGAVNVAGTGYGRDAVSRCRVSLRQQASRVNSRGEQEPFQRSVDSAVSTMDTFFAACRDSSSPVADDATAPTPATSPQVTTTPQETTTPQTPPADAQPPSSIRTALDMAQVATAIGTFFAATEGNVTPSGAVRALVTTVVSARLLSAFFGQDNRPGMTTPETISRDIGDAAAAANAARNTSIAFAAGSAGGVAFGSAVAGVAVGSMIERHTHIGERISIWYADYRWEQENMPPSAQRPNPDSSRPTCAQMAAAWRSFVAYCSQPGNNWQSFDCLSAISRLNGCADPRLIKPGPDGNFVCAGRPDRKQAAVAACKLHRKFRGMFEAGAQINKLSRGVPDCGATVEMIAGVRNVAAAIFTRGVCERTTPDSDSALCGVPALPVPGDGASPRPKPAP